MVGVELVTAYDEVPYIIPYGSAGERGEGATTAAEADGPLRAENDWVWSGCDAAPSKLAMAYLVNAVAEVGRDPAEVPVTGVDELRSGAGSLTGEVDPVVE